MTSNIAKIILPDGRSAELPIINSTMGPDVLDIRSLYKDLGYFTYDPGFTSTASCESSITYIDGEAGILLHRGYPIEDLASNSTFTDVAHLLVYGEMPSESERKRWKEDLAAHSLLHEQVIKFYNGFRRGSHPMSIMVGVVGALSSFYHDKLDINDPEQRDLSIKRLIAKVSTIAGYAYKYSVGLPFMYPKNSLNYSENLTHMLFALPTEEYKVDAIIASAIDKILILHADHEQNASTSTVRLAGSSQANPFACIAAGVASLWGPSHGGANEAVLKMLEEIGSKENIGKFLKKAQDKSDPFRLMGFGHRVYRNYDPRATVIRQSCHEVLGHLGIKDPLLDLAMELERIALQDEYFIERKLFPNVDFYSGIILKAIGIPTSMFTVLFAVSRTVGWLSQWNEMIQHSEKIGRPRQLYVGEKERSYKP